MVHQWVLAAYAWWRKDQQVHSWAGNRTRWDWALNVLAMCASIVWSVELGYLATYYNRDNRVHHKDHCTHKLVEVTIKGNWVISAVCGAVLVFIDLFSIYLFVSDIYVGWLTNISLWCNQRGWGEKYPRWVVCNTVMNLSICFAAFTTIHPVLWVGSSFVTLIAAISRVHRKGDPSGLTEGFTTCLIVCFFTYLVDYKNKLSLSFTSLVFAILCFISSIAPPPETHVGDEEAGFAGPPPTPSPTVQVSSSPSQPTGDQGDSDNDGQERNRVPISNGNSKRSKITKPSPPPSSGVNSSLKYDLKGTNGRLAGLRDGQGSSCKVQGHACSTSAPKARPTKECDQVLISKGASKSSVIMKPGPPLY